jgi:hypothetical protein
LPEKKGVPHLGQDGAALRDGSAMVHAGRDGAASSRRLAAPEVFSLSPP